MPEADTANYTDEDSQDAERIGSKSIEDENQQSQSDDENTGIQPDVTESDDDSLLDHDPLIKAFLPPKGDSNTAEDAEPLATSDPVNPATPKPAVKVEKPKADEPKLEAKPQDEDAETSAQSMANLADEDWQKLSHKSKSTFLAQRREIRKHQEAIATIKAEADNASEDYQVVERFRGELGLDPDEYRNGLLLLGAAKKNDIRVVQFLENTIAEIRQANGQPDPVTESAPALDVDSLKSLVEDYTNTLDEAPLMEFIANLSKKPTAKPEPKPKQESQPIEQQQPQPQQVHQDAIRENESTLDALEALGVDSESVAGYAKSLIADVVKGNGGKPPPVGQRMRAVLAQHQKRVAARAATTTPKPRPLTGGSSAVPRRSVPNTDQQDPLSNAIRRNG